MRDEGGLLSVLTFGRDHIFAFFSRFPASWVRALPAAEFIACWVQMRFACTQVISSHITRASPPKVGRHYILKLGAAKERFLLPAFSCFFGFSLLYCPCANTAREYLPVTVGGWPSSFRIGRVKFLFRVSPGPPGREGCPWIRSRGLKSFSTPWYSFPLLHCLWQSDIKRNNRSTQGTRLFL